MHKSAILKDSIVTIECEFCIEYGCYPYDYYKKLLDDGLSSSDAMAKTQSRVNIVWFDMLYTYRKQSESCE